MVVESICSAPAAKTCPSSTCQAFRFGFGFARVSRPGLNVQYNCKLVLYHETYGFKKSRSQIFPELAAALPELNITASRHDRRDTADGFFAFCSA